MGENEVEVTETETNGKDKIEDVIEDELEDVTIEVIYPDDEEDKIKAQPQAKKPSAVAAKAKQKSSAQSSVEEVKASGRASMQAEAAGAATPDIQVSEFQQQIDALTREKNSLYDQLLRRAAEFENYRKRADREKVENYNRARADVILELLPVIDNFERALSSLEKSSEDAQGMRHGVELIHKQFKDALSKFGLKEIEAIGKTFDPNVHEAVTLEATDEHEENTVIEEFERGYRLGDRLLRPSKVKVASSPGEN